MTFDFLCMLYFLVLTFCWCQRGREKSLWLDLVLAWLICTFYLFYEMHWLFILIYAHMHKLIKNIYFTLILCLDPLYIDKNRYNYEILSGIHSLVHACICGIGYVHYKESYDIVGLKGEKCGNMHLCLWDKLLHVLN